MKAKGSGPLRGIDRSRRQDIVRAVREGRAVNNPRNAGLAAAWAEQLLAIGARSRRRRWLVVQGLGLALVAVLVRNPIVLIAELVVVLAIVGQFLLWRTAMEGVRRSARANRELAVALALEVPALDSLSWHDYSGSIGSRKGLAAIAVTALVMAGVVAGAVLFRGAAEDVMTGSWARQANAICSGIGDAYHRRRQVGLEPEVSLRERAEIHERAVMIQQEAATKLWALSPPSGPATVAVEALERKIQLERNAVRAARNGDRNGFDERMRAVVPPVLVAQRAFAQAGANICSSHI